MIKLMRVDERLIHGQIAFAWTNAIGANCIFVVNDDAANSPFRKSSLKLATPPGVKLVIKNVNDAKAALSGDAIDKYNFFLIVDNVKDALELAKSSDKIKHLNLGNIKLADGKKQITNSVYLSEEEFEYIEALKKIGVEVECRAIPNDTKVDPLGGEQNA